MNVPGKLTKGKDLKDKTARERQTGKENERERQEDWMTVNRERVIIMSRNLLLMYLLTALFICSYCQ